MTKKKTDKKTDKKTITYKNRGSKFDLYFAIGKYSDNGNLYLGFLEGPSECFCDISCNYGILGKNEIMLDHDLLEMMSELKNKLINEGIIELKGFTGIYKVNVDKIKDEYKYVNLGVNF